MMVASAREFLPRNIFETNEFRYGMEAKWRYDGKELREEKKSVNE